MKKVVARGFNILTAITNLIKDVLEVMLKFEISKKRVKPSLNLVSNCILFGLFKGKILFSEGRINFKTLPLKLVRLSELRMLKSSLFHSIKVEGKKEFLK